MIAALDLSRDARRALEVATVGARGQFAQGEREANGSTDNLPLRLTPLVGREEDGRDLVMPIAKHRLVTIVGRSGVGNTRTALEVAAHYARNASDEVWLVDLVALDESASMFDNCVDRRDASKTRPPVSLQAILFREIWSLERRMAPIAFKPPQLLNKHL